jgi:hypothetical protein
MKLRCDKCGAQFDGPDGIVAGRLRQHEEREHGSVEARHTATLTKCLAVIQSCMVGQKTPKFELRQIHNEISDLLKVPRAPEEITSATPIPVVNSSVSQNVSHAEGVPAPQRDGSGDVPSASIGPGQDHAAKT